MKILIFNWQDIKNPFGGGAEVHMHEIFKRLAKMGHDITLFCCEFENAPKNEIIDGIKVIRKGKRDFFNFLVLYYYFKIFKNQHFDLIIDDLNKIPFYCPLFVKEPLLAISHHFFGKSIYREAGIITGTYVYLAEKLVNCVYKKTKFVVVSQSTLDEFIQRGFDKNHFSIVFNAITQENFPMSVGIKNRIPTVSYFGRLKKYKSVDHLFKAFALVLKKIDNAELHILGRGDFMPQLKELAKELNISDKTKFFGFVSESEKVSLLTQSHCVGNTSMKEGWGITNIEANACGTPVISANVPGLKDSVKNSSSGLLYEYGNIEELADKILQIFTNEELSTKLCNGSVEWAKSFSWDKSAEKMNEIINDFIKIP